MGAAGTKNVKSDFQKVNLVSHDRHHLSRCRAFSHVIPLAGRHWAGPVGSGLGGDPPGVRLIGIGGDSRHRMSAGLCWLAPWADGMHVRCASGVLINIFYFSLPIIKNNY